MPLATTITMPSDLAPVFPNRCVVCSFAADSKSKIVQGSVPSVLAFLLPILHLFNWSRVEFPLCRRCRTRFFVQRWGRTLFMVVAVVIAVTFVAPRFDRFDPALSRYLVVGSALVVLIPYVIYESVVPRWFNSFSGRGSTTYEFSSQMVAMQFYVANSQRYPDSKVRIDMDWKLPRK